MMKRCLYCATVAALALSIVPAMAQDEAAQPEAAATAEEGADAATKSSVQLQDDADRLSYSVGFQVGNSLKDLPNLDLEVFMAGIKDNLEDKAPSVSEADMQTVIMQAMQQLQQEQQQKTAASNEEYLAANAKKEGVKTTASGLQYRVLEEGSGASPAATDTVTVHYRGTLVDGTQFDSSYDRGEPATFPLNQVIKGWTEGLQLMKEGAKYEFVIPGNLAYPQGRPGIPPGAVLVFEVELIKVEKAGGAGNQEIVLE